MSVDLVIAADVLADYPHLVPDTGGCSEYDNFKVCQDISLRDCNLYFPLSEIYSLQDIRDSLSSSPSRIKRSRIALERLAGLCPKISDRIQIVNEAPARYVLLSNLPERRILASLCSQTALPFRPPRPVCRPGIRYAQIPTAFHEQFCANGSFSLADFQQLFPEVPPFQPNEYLVLFAGEETESLFPEHPTVQNAAMNSGDYFEHIARYDAENQIFHQLQYFNHFGPNFPRNNPALAAYADALNDPHIDVIVVSGPAGSGKTYTAFDYGLNACRNGDYLRCVVLEKGSSSVGAIRGGIEKKMLPMTQYGRDALRNAILQSSNMQKKLRNQSAHGRPERSGLDVTEQIESIVKQQWEHNFESIPFEYANGRSFDHRLILIDEVQRIRLDLLDTLLTRSGRHSKMVVMGDYAQLPTGVNPKYCGLSYARQLFAGSPRAAYIELNKIMRGPIAATVVENRQRVREAFGLST